MRPILYTAALVALLAVVPLDFGRQVLAGTAAILIEATPFVFLSALMERWLRGSWLAYAGCGCTGGASARSIPAALATALLFGPVVAGMRVAAASVTARIIGARGTHAHANPLDGLARLFIPALLTSIGLALLAHLPPVHLSWIEQGALGLVLGFFCAPCALGSVAIAAALHMRLPLATFVFLAVAGIADLRTWTPVCRPQRTHRDSLAYALVAACLAFVCARRGDALVNPRIVMLLILGAMSAVAYMFYEGFSTSGRRCTIPLVMFAGAMLNAPAPTYAADVTTLDLFAGERVQFSGALTSSHDALVRYTIICCRADATPRVLRLTHAVHARAGTWFAIDGTIVRARDTFAVSGTPHALAAPADPFLYQ